MNGEVSLLDSRAKQVGYFELTEHSTIVAQTLMMFISTFYWPQAVEKNITERLVKNLVTQLPSKLK